MIACGARLHDMGIDSRRDISAVILTHLHHDHTGGLDHFPHTKIIVPRKGDTSPIGLIEQIFGVNEQVPGRGQSD